MGRRETSSAPMSRERIDGRKFFIETFQQIKVEKKKQKFYDHHLPFFLFLIKKNLRKHHQQTLKSRGDNRKLYNEGISLTISGLSRHDMKQWKTQHYLVIILP